MVQQAVSRQPICILRRLMDQARGCPWSPHLDVQSILTASYSARDRGGGSIQIHKVSMDVRQKYQLYVFSSGHFIDHGLRDQIQRVPRTYGTLSEIQSREFIGCRDQSCRKWCYIM